jgi:UDP-N-acetyl-D-glucosamine dehydrogenase
MSDAVIGLVERIRNRSARVGIIGLGYVGLPLARAFARTGFRVLGFDIDPVKVARLNAGQSYIKQIPDATIAGMRDKGFEATDRFDRLGEPDAILVCVPTPLTDAREPDLTYVVNSAHAVAGQLRPGQLVVLESTTYPTTTRDVVLPILERTGLTPGRDFLLAFSPEREDPGNATFSVNNIPKVVGGLDRPSSDAACALYAAVVPQVVRVSAPEVAEACKILENTYRAVNIALVNELKVLYDRMGIDVWEVIDAAKTKPFGFQAFYPRPGARWALHSGRPLLPHLGGQEVWNEHAVHRTGRRGQHRDADIRGEQNRRRPERGQYASEGEQGGDPRHGVQERCRRPPGVSLLRNTVAREGLRAEKRRKTR